MRRSTSVRVTWQGIFTVLNPGEDMIRAKLDAADRRLRGRLGRALRRVSRWYAIRCAREDAVRAGFVVDERLLYEAPQPESDWLI
jgi:hypothetical protein